MFNNAINITELDLSGFDISNVSSANAIFAYTNNLTNLNMDNWDLSNINGPEVFSGMFYDSSVKNVSCKNWT